MSTYGPRESRIPDEFRAAARRAYVDAGSPTNNELMACVEFDLDGSRVTVCVGFGTWADAVSAGAEAGARRNGGFDRDLCDDIGGAS